MESLLICLSWKCISFIIWNFLLRFLPVCAQGWQSLEWQRDFNLWSPCEIPWDLGEIPLRGGKRESQQVEIAAGDMSGSGSGCRWEPIRMLDVHLWTSVDRSVKQEGGFRREEEALSGISVEVLWGLPPQRLYPPEKGNREGYQSLPEGRPPFPPEDLPFYSDHNPRATPLRWKKPSYKIPSL